MHYDLVIAGAGLAGACAALHLARDHRILVLDAARPGSGAASAAAGLVNPFLGQKAKPTWHLDAALAALHHTLDLASASSLFRSSGVLRPAKGQKQADAFRSTAATFPTRTAWLDTHDALAKVPGLLAPDGALWILDGGSIDIPAMVEAVLGRAKEFGAAVRPHTRLASWEERPPSCFAITDQGEHIETERLLLALGDGFLAFPALQALPLHRVKGQTIRVQTPDGMPPSVPALSGNGYLVPTPDGIVIGSTFEHDFSDLAPNEAASQYLLARATTLLPALARARVLDARAGVRVTVPRSRLPLLGPLPGHDHVWMFTGLGAKGLVTAPYLASLLPSWLADPDAIFEEVSTRRFA